MSDEELVLLIQQGKDVKSNMELLYNQCSSYIRKIARNYTNISDMEDLIQEGYIALVDAVNDFDATAGQKFISWLFIRLLRQYENHCLNNKRGIVSNRRYNIFAIRYLKLKKYFNLTYNRDPDMRECIAYLRMSVDMINKVKSATYYDKTTSLDKTYSGEGGDDEFTLGMTLISNDNIEHSVIDKIMGEDLKTGLWKIVKDNVTDDEYVVIRAMYMHNMSFEKCTSLCKSSRYDVSNNYHNAMGKLRMHKVKRQIADRFGFEYSRTVKSELSDYKNTFTSPVKKVATEHIEKELEYLKYVLTAAKDGIELLTPEQINLAIDYGYINQDFEVCVRWEVPKHGIATEPIEQYDLNGTFIKRWDSAQEAVDYIGVTIDGIRRCLLGYRKSSSGFIWKKVDREGALV